MEEQWRSVRGYESIYSVSLSGEVRRDKPACGARVGHILRPALSNTGYPFVVLRKDGQSSSYFVHTLVARAFLGEPPPGHEVNHLDCNTANPSLDNLEYVTRKGNMAYAESLGRTSPPPVHHGSANHKAKLTPDQVAAIRQSPEPITVWAKRLGVNKSTIARARVGVGWTTVDTAPVARLDSTKPRPWAKLTAADILAIRESEEPARVMAERFGVGKGAICRVRNGETWQHLPGEAVRKITPERHHLSTKLTADDVRAIRASAESNTALAHIYGVTPEAIISIRLRKTWKHL